MSNKDEECVSEPNVGARGVRIEPTFDPLFLEIGVPLVLFQESRGVPAREALRECAQSPKPFDAHTLRSRLSNYDLKLLYERCEISPIIKLRLPDENESANMTTLDEIGVYWDMFINGFKVPIHPFFIRVLKVYGLAPGQFSPHAWRFMSFFIYQCHKLGLNPRTDLEHIEKLKGAEPLKSRYPLSNAQLCEWGIIFPPEPQDFADEADEEEEEEGENDPENMSSRAQGDPPLFNAQGVLGDIIPDELALIHGIEEKEMKDLDFGALVSGSQPKVTETQTENFFLGLTSVDRSKETSKKRRVLSRAGSRAASSSAMAQVQIGMEKLIVADKVLDEEKKKVMIENNFRREAKKKVEDLSKKLERVEMSNAGLTAKYVELTAQVNDLEAEKSSVALQAVQLFKRSKVFLDQRLRDSKGALVHGYNECKSNVLKDHPEMDMSIYEHKFASEVASETERRAEEAEHKRAASFQALTSPSMSRSVGASGSVSMVVSRPQLPLAEGCSQEMELPTDVAEQND
ncbi:hypothetical protein RJ639_018143 [Escallonia herrerae]|uniref:Transposase (putative) gypsy type domain-containing protein n=1 Tax=Escallonia herrerae TaxID=1293975 RepID=A0AA88V9C2_9ASTE|nr:hypothetical protein RJ639_018143 [Escallonia herrerae]